MVIITLMVSEKIWEEVRGLNSSLEEKEGKDKGQGNKKTE